MHIVDSHFDGRDFVAVHSSLDDADLSDAVLKPAEDPALDFPESLTTHGAIRTIGECAFLEARARRQEAAKVLQGDADLNIDEVPGISQARLARDHAHLALRNFFMYGDELKPETVFPY